MKATAVALGVFAARAVAIIGDLNAKLTISIGRPTCDRSSSAAVSVPSGYPTWAPEPPKWTTSTIWSTSVSTIISCPPIVTNCPAHSTVLTTVTIAVSTTVCPVIETPSSTQAPPPPPPPSATSPSNPVASPSPPPAASASSTTSAGSASPPAISSTSAWVASPPPSPYTSVTSTKPTTSGPLPPPPPPPPSAPVVSSSSSAVAPPRPPPPVVTSYPTLTKSVGTISLPSRTTSSGQAIVTAGAGHTAQRAGGALAAIAVAAAFM